MCVGPACLQDSFNRGPSNGGAHYATVLMYLSDVEEGGETVNNRDCCSDGSHQPSAPGDNVERFGLVPRSCGRFDNLPLTELVQQQQ